MTGITFRTFFKLTIRSPWIWAVTAACTALLLLRSMNGLKGASGFVYVFGEQSLLMSLFILGQMLAMVADTHREGSAHVTELLEALPYGTGGWVIGRLLAAYMAWLAAGTTLWVLGAGLLVLRWGEAFDPVLVWGWLRLLPVTMIFSTGVAVGVGSLVKREFGAYLLVIVTFLAGRFLPGILSSLFHAAPSTALDFDLTSFFPLDAAGAFPNAVPLVLNRVSVAGVGVAVAAIVAWLGSRRRKDSDRTLLAVAAVGACIVAVGAICASQWISNQRMEAAIAEVTNYSEPPASPVALAPSVNAYNISASFDLKANRLLGDADVDLAAPGTQSVFTLRRSFRVTGILGPESEPVPFTQDGDTLTVDTGGIGGHYRIRYEGEVWQWRIRQGLRLAAHVAPESIVLPATFGWYPMPGDIPLGTLDQENGLRASDNGVWHNPVPFVLSTSGTERLHVVTNADGRNPVAGAWLVATPNAARTVADMEMYLSTPNLHQGNKLAQRYGPEAAFYQELVPLAQPLRLIELPASLWYASNSLEIVSGFPGAVILWSTPFGIMDDGDWINVIRAHLITWWWGNGRTPEEHQIHEVLSRFMSELYGKSHPSVAINFPTQHNADINTEAAETTLNALRRFSELQGLESTGRVLRSLHGTDTPLDWQRVSDALEGEH